MTASGGTGKGGGGGGSQESVEVAGRGGGGGEQKIVRGDGAKQMMRGWWGGDFGEEGMYKFGLKADLHTGSLEGSPIYQGRWCVCMRRSHMYSRGLACRVKAKMLWINMMT